MGDNIIIENDKNGLFEAYLDELIDRDYLNEEQKVLKERLEYIQKRLENIKNYKKMVEDDLIRIKVRKLGKHIEDEDERVKIINKIIERKEQEYLKRWELLENNINLYLTKTIKFIKHKYLENLGYSI